MSLPKSRTASPRTKVPTLTQVADEVSAPTLAPGVVQQNTVSVVGIPSRAASATYANSAKESADAAAKAVDEVKELVENLPMATTETKGWVVLASELKDSESTKVVTEGLAVTELQGQFVTKNVESPQTMLGDIVKTSSTLANSDPGTLTEKAYVDVAVVEDKVLTIPLISDTPGPDSGYTYNSTTTQVTIDLKKFIHKIKIEDIDPSIRVLLFTLVNPVKGDDIQVYLHKPAGVSVRYFIETEMTSADVMPASDIQKDLHYLLSFVSMDTVSVLPISAYCIK